MNEKITLLEKSIVSPKLIDKLWPHIWVAIKKSVEDFDLETEEEVKEDLVGGNRLILIAGNGVAIVRIGGLSKKFVEINYVGGKNLKKWWPKISEAIGALASSAGAKKIFTFGRPAWKKLAPDLTATSNIMYIKEIA